MSHPESLREALRQSEERFRLMVESVVDYGIFMLDPRGHIASWNRGAERINGYSEEEVLGKHFSIFYTAEDRERHYPEYELTVAAREGRFEDEGWRLRKDGSRFWSNVVITALRDEEGRLVGFGKVTRDLTERRQAEAERTALLRERVARQEAEELAEEVQNQAAHLEEQAAELEALNEDLSASRARLQITIDSSLDAVITIDPRSVILDWSRQAEAMFGWSAAEAIGQRLEDTIMPPQHREAHRRGVERYLATGSGRIMNRRIEITALRRDGQEFPVELTVGAADHGEEVIFTAFIRDISVPKRLERQRMAEHAVTRILAECHSLEGAAPRVLEAMGTVLQWEVGTFWTLNDEGSRLRPLALWHAPGVRADEFERATREAAFQPDEGLPGRIWARRKPVWIADVEEADRFPRATAAAEVGLHGAFGFPLFAGDRFMGVVEFFHRHVVEADEALLQSVEVIGRDIAQALQRIAAEAERDLLLARSRETAMEMQAQAVQLLTHREEADRARADAEMANRAKSDFLATMSHELRTPINAIMGYTDLLMMGVPDPASEGQSAQLERIQASSRHLLMLVEDILDVAKLDAGRIEVARERVRVQDTVEAALSLLGPTAQERRIEMESRCASRSDAWYSGDEDRVRQILVNLLSNAVKFTEPGGRVAVECEVVEGSGRRGRGRAAGPWVRVAVEDTGIGIPEDRLEAVFEPFVQAETGTTRTHGGTGLGLTISRRLARLMDGELTLESERGRGTRATLWLPAAGASSGG